MLQTMMQLSALVAHDLHLELLPADQALLDEQLRWSATGQAALADLFELFRRCRRMPPTRAAHREAGADDHRKAGATDVGLDALLILLWTASASSMRCAMPLLAEFSTDGRHRVLELHAVLGLLDGRRSLAPIISTPYFSSTPCRCRSSAQLSAVWPPTGRLSRASGQALLGDDLLHHLPGDRLDVGHVGHGSGSVMIVAGLLLTRMTL